MREILFRGKRMDNGEWVWGFLAFDGVSEDYYIYDREVDPDTVGQYTGLQDKNGKRIFEGDICRNTKTGEIVSVKWHGTMAGFVWRRREENSNLSDFGELFRVHDKYEVIGNIHDNPELMDGGAENE